MAKPDDYEIGYGKPPRHTQFQKGKTGNFKGRPKGSKNPLTLLEQIMHTNINVTENGRTRKVTKFEAALIQLVNKAASGDLRALRDVINLRAVLVNTKDDGARVELDEKERATWHSLLKRLSTYQPRVNEVVGEGEPLLPNAKEEQ